MQKSIKNQTGFSALRYKSGFTIVELLVVIVVIGILAVIAIVSYSGLNQKATIASIQSDLSSNANKLKLYQAEYGSYPTALDANNCPTAPTVDAKHCLKASDGATLSYTGTASTFGLTNTRNATTYIITESASPQIVPPSLADTDPTNWLKIGTQVWAKANLNVGTMVPGTFGGSNATNQTNNAVVEKYCYQNKAANCTTYGGLYQWNEAMQYVTTEGIQGICPADSHIPTDNDWKILEMQLGMTQAQADTLNAWRGTDQGTQLKTGGVSGLNVTLGGERDASGTFFSIGTDTRLWSSSQSGSDALVRNLTSSTTSVARSTYAKTYGYSVRCLGN